MGIPPITVTHSGLRATVSQDEEDIWLTFPIPRENMEYLNAVNGIGSKYTLTEMSGNFNAHILMKVSTQGNLVDVIRQATREAYFAIDQYLDSCAKMKRDAEYKPGIPEQEVAGEPKVAHNYERDGFLAVLHDNGDDTYDVEARGISDDLETDWEHFEELLATSTPIVEGEDGWGRFTIDGRGASIDDLAERIINHALDSSSTSDSDDDTEDYTDEADTLFIHHEGMEISLIRYNNKREVYVYIVRTEGKFGDAVGDLSSDMMIETLEPMVLDIIRQDENHLTILLASDDTPRNSLDYWSKLVLSSMDSCIVREPDQPIEPEYEPVVIVRLSDLRTIQAEVLKGNKHWEMEYLPIRRKN